MVTQGLEQQGIDTEQEIRRFFSVRVRGNGGIDDEVEMYPKGLGTQ